MIHKKIRIIKPEKYLNVLNYDDSIKIAIKIDTEIEEISKDIGFSNELLVGEAIIPDRRLSKSAIENLDGKVLVRKDIPKETVYRYFEWSWEDWAGTTHYDSTYVPYERYTREFLPPESIELIIVQDKDNTKWIVTNSLKNAKEDHQRIKLAMNLFLSIFGQFEIINDDMSVPIKITKTFDWEFLKPGKLTQEEIDNKVRNSIHQIGKPMKQNMHYKNYQILREATKGSVCIGSKGFSGYLGFPIPEKNIVILESLLPNNATYILDSNWEDISRLTKKEVLFGKLYVDRIYHNNNWNEKIVPYIKDIS